MNLTTSIAMAEEYYANAQDETSYSYDDNNDNLNVKTIQNS